MKLEAEQALCRILLSNLVRHGSEPLYEWIDVREVMSGASSDG